MTKQFVVLLISGDSLQFELEAGDVLFVLGANGTGKSSLISHFTRQHSGNVRRISAHRQMWFDQDVINVSPVDRMNLRTNTSNFDREPNARYRDIYGAQRPNAIVFDLVENENIRARAIADAMDAHLEERARELSKNKGPIKKINDLFAMANLPVQFNYEARAQLLASRGGGQPFSVAHLSDGERNALIISSEVLTSEPGTLLLIDEPERHLHRSISAPLINGLMAERPDCIFVISSHDIGLAQEYPDATVLLLRDSSYAHGTIKWDAYLLAANKAVDDQLRFDILGARRKILFVEGEPQSLDKSLYGLLFPNVSVIAKGASRNVQQAVSAIRASYELHWLCPFGLIDNDNRTPSDIEKLKSDFVYALPHYSVESIYYHTDIQMRVAERFAGVTGYEAAQSISSARGDALDALSGNGKRLSERAILLKLRAQVMSQLPRSQDIEAGTPIQIAIDTQAVVAAEQSRFDALVQSNNLEQLIRDYPVRETGALGAISSALGFQGRKQYESAVRKLLIDDPSALTLVRGLFGDLPAAIDGA